MTQFDDAVHHVGDIHGSRRVSEMVVLYLQSGSMNAGTPLAFSYLFRLGLQPIWCHPHSGEFPA